MIGHQSRIVEQQLVDDIEAHTVQHVDLLITAASWDSRGPHNLKIQWAALKSAIVLCYSDKGTTGRVQSFEEAMPSLISECGATVQLLDMEDSTTSSNWKRLRDLIVAEYRKLGRPLHIALDLNVVPRYLSLAVLGYGSRSGIAAMCTYVYTAATGYKGEGHETRTFTDGEWLPVSIPSLSSGGPASARSHLVVSGGFEGASTRRLVNALEPDRVSLILAKGISPEHDRTAEQVNAPLKSDYLLDQTSVRFAPVMDIDTAIGVVVPFARFHKGAHQGEPSTYASFLLCGPKTISLAMAIAALDNPVSHVYYALPERHREHDVTGFGQSLVTTVRL